MVTRLWEFLGGEGFMPHGHCYLWEPGLLWTYVLSDSLIGIAYFSIPLSLVYFVRHRRDVQFNWVAVMFSVFIFACGTTHFIAVWTIWNPVYWLDASMKAVTAFASIVTSIMLWRLMPLALKIPSNRQLQATVAQLRHEVVERRQAEEALALVNETLEQRVLQRTAELMAINQQLQTEINARAWTESELFSEKQRAVVTLECIGDGVITTDTRSHITYINPVAEKLTGWTKAQALGKPLLEVFRVVNETTRKLIPNPVDIVLEQGICGLGNHSLLLSRGGLEFAIEESAAPIQDHDGNVLGVVMVIHDVSEKRKMAQRMTYLAEHDFLTDLPNRLLLNDRLSQSLMLARRDGYYVALMFIDLDHFKNINDSLGHEVGDQLLKTISKRFAQCLRDSDTLSRQGGDEFIVLLPEITDHFAPAEVAEKLLAAAATSFDILGHELRISASIGIAVFPDDGDTVETLTKRADAAMYHAKSLGRNNYQFFTQSMNERVSELAMLEHNLRRALDHDEFELNFQPKVEIATGRIMGAEVLLRWRHPEWGIVMPDRFIPIAESTGLIRSIGGWVIREACRQSRRWQEQGLSVVPLAINLSAVQLRQKSFLQEITQILLQSGTDLRMLEFEVTESVAIEGEDAVIEWLQMLKNMGVGLSIDDFGTGYSSLSYLKRLPVDTLKIDKSFVRDIYTDPDDATIITAIIRMSHGLRLSVVAEGVETVEQLDFLRAEGCNQFQGYLVSTPLSAEAFAMFMSEWRDERLQEFYHALS